MWSEAGGTYHGLCLMISGLLGRLSHKGLATRKDMDIADASNANASVSTVK